MHEPRAKFSAHILMEKGLEGLEPSIGEAELCRPNAYLVALVLLGEEEQDINLALPVLI